MLIKSWPQGIFLIKFRHYVYFISLANCLFTFSLFLGEEVAMFLKLWWLFGSCSCGNHPGLLVLEPLQYYSFNQATSTFLLKFHCPFCALWIFVSNKNPQIWLWVCRKYVNKNSFVVHTEFPDSGIYFINKFIL